MPGDEFGDRTEQPTDRRRTEAREKGNVARSVDLTSAGVMLATAATLFLLGSGLTQSMARLLHASLSGPSWLGIDADLALKQAWGLSEFLTASVLPFMLLIMMAAMFFCVVQVGFLVTPEVLQPKFSRLNPLEGAKRILSMRGLMKLAVSLGKLAVLVAISAWWISSELPSFLELSGAEPSRIMVVIGSSLVKLAFLLSLALLILGVLDFAFQKWKYEQDLRMTKQEIRDEMKNMEGDPLIRQRRRDAHRKLALARELGQVQDADVVITNPTEIAVAIKYDPDKMPAPAVVAKGKGEIAGRIRRIAIEHDIPIIERKPLAQALYRDVKVGQPVPIEMYEVFAEIMAYVYRLSGKAAPKLT